MTDQQLITLLWLIGAAVYLALTFRRVWRATDSPAPVVDVYTGECPDPLERLMDPSELPTPTLAELDEAARRLACGISLPTRRPRPYVDTRGRLVNFDPERV